jgi:peptidoglycan/LPS O-acetylase OafA/YrhL
MSTEDLKVGPALGATGTAKRVQWLDGVRALAATFVMLHHSFLMTVGGYPGNNGPWFTDWLIYGHLAVSVFIVVSGYSLALAPIRNGFRFKDGAVGFLRRRFWRIVPPYWAALVLVTLLIAAGLTDPANGTDYGPRDFTINFLLLQDTFGNVSPNGAFWSIAVEWHIYFLYPVVLLLFRRWGIRIVVLFVLVIVVVQHLIGLWVPVVAMLNRFTPVYLFLFVCGVTAAWLVHRQRGAKSGVAVAVVLLSGFLVYAAIAGTEATTSSYFWVDLTVGSATAALFVALDQGRVRWVVWVLSLRPLVTVGSFAFSLYLIHAPVLAMLTTFVVKPLGADDIPSFALLLTLGLPASIGAAYLFFLLFERPFLTIRSFSQLSSAIRGSFNVRKISLWRTPQESRLAPSRVPGNHWRKDS